VGCGGGIATAALAGLGYHVTGVDQSAPSLEEAR
jgi:2-polyprenyl-3-methyl-5-hydroxy-6-metoxy-1,4-benzoquinol methylase